MRGKTQRLAPYEVEQGVERTGVGAPTTASSELFDAHATQSDQRSEEHAPEYEREETEPQRSHHRHDEQSDEAAARDSDTAAVHVDARHPLILSVRVRNCYGRTAVFVTAPSGRTLIPPPPGRKFPGS
jgi:hypothetical protein